MIGPSSVRSMRRFTSTRSSSCVDVDLGHERVQVELGDHGVEVDLHHDPVDDRCEHGRIEPDQHTHDVDAVDQVVDVDLRQDRVEVDSIDQRVDVDPSEDGLDVDAVDDLIDVDRVDDGRRNLVHDRLEDRGGVVLQRVEQRGPARPSQRGGAGIDRHRVGWPSRSGGGRVGAASLVA